MRVLRSTLRLGRSFWVLARYDALWLPQYQQRLPWIVRQAGRLARFLAPRHKNTPEEKNLSPLHNAGLRLARAFEDLGPAYIKLGQLLSTRADILDPDFAEGLSRLKDATTPFPQDQARDVVEAELGQPLDKLFKSFGPPMASASIAQVHKAIDHEGRALAVKVLRPGIERRIAEDCEGFAYWASVLEKRLPETRRLRPVAFIETVARALERETDLRLEAGAASEMAELTAKIEGLKVPEVFWPLTSRRVLTLAWVEGQPLSSKAVLENLEPEQRQKLALIVTRSFLTTALDDGMFHADMHEGNLILTPDGSLALVDYGIIGRLNQEQRRYLAEILYGFLVRDYRRVAQLHFDAGYVEPPHTPEEFATALRAVGEPVFGLSADQVSMGRVLLHLFDNTRLFDMKLRPELVLLQKNMIQAEGAARRLDPHHDMWEAARPVVEAWMRRELGLKARVKSLASDLNQARKAFSELPKTLQTISGAAEKFQQGQINLGEETLRQLTQAQRKGRPGWALVCVMIVAALALGFVLAEKGWLSG